MLTATASGAISDRVPDPARSAETRSRAMPCVLRDILDPGVSLCVWNRPMSPAVRHAMVGVHAFMPVHRLFNLPPHAPAQEALAAAVAVFPGMKDASARAWQDDLMRLLTLARGLAPDAALRVRLETKANDACRRFHVDSIALRMICTYRGGGTQWLPGHAVDRACLGSSSDEHVLDASAMREIPTGAVAVMKGLRYPGRAADALVHRSPPATAAEPRVVAVVDILI